MLVLLFGAGTLDISQQHILQSSLRNQVARGMEEKAHLLALRVASAAPDSFPSLAQEQARAAGAQVMVLTGQGKVLADSAAPGEEAVSPATPLGTTLDTPEVRALTVQHRANGKRIAHGMMYVTAPAGAYIVRLAYPLGEVEETLHQVRGSLLWATLLALLLATLVAAFLAHAVARRLARIIEFAHRLAAGDFSVRIHDTEGDEIAQVAKALDATAARLEGVFGALEDSRKQMETVLDSMEEAVIAVDAQSRIQWTNRVMERLAGIPLQSGSALVKIIRDPDLLACVDQSLRQRITGKARARSVLPGRIFEVSVAPMLGGSAVVVLHDVTEIERVEKTRRDFIANVSHELRTPLTSISGYAETMLEEDTGLPPQARDFLGIICRNAARMTRLTEDLLALARIESGEYKLHPKPVSSEFLIDEAMGVLGASFMTAGVAIEKGEIERSPVRADTDAILQVLSNLLENAVKYGGGGKRVIVGSRAIPGAVEFFVRDFGTGIPSDHLDRIFERFYRVDKGRSRDSGGTGLGLSIAKHIILAHGGSIRVKSELNHGATFFFTLPKVEQTTEPAAWDADPPQNQSASA